MDSFESGEWEHKFLNPDDVSAWLANPDGLNELSYLVADEIHQHYATVMDLLRVLSSDPRIGLLLKEPLDENYTLQHSVDHMAERTHKLNQMAETLRSLSVALRKGGSSSHSDLHEES